MIKLLILVIITYVATSRSNQDLRATLVTGLWDISRGDMVIFKRPFEYYLKFFKDILQIKDNVIIFGNSQLKKFVQQNRKYKDNIFFVEKDFKDIEKYWYTEKMWNVIDETKKDFIKWNMYSVYPQYGLKMYNPIVMSKMRFIYQASKVDPFNSDYYIWVDGGLTHSMDKCVIEQGSLINTERVFQIDWFIQTGKKLPYHPFDISYKHQGRDYAPVTSKQRLYVWGNWLGGKASAASSAYHIFQNFLRVILQHGQMNTDQSILFLMLERYNYLFHRLNDPDTINFLKKIRINSSVVQQKYSLREIKLSEVLQYTNLINVNDQPCEQPKKLTKIFHIEDLHYFQLIDNILKYSLNVRMIILIVSVVFLLIFKASLKVNKFSYLPDSEYN